VCEFVVSGKTGPIILVALAAHHTPTITQCNGTSWKNKGVSME
jgi:hypothetical protein